MAREATAVQVVILNWNGWQDTAACVASVRAQDLSCSIVVVDNASSDGSEARLRAAFPWLTVLQSGKNRGYAGGNNIGLRHALAHGAQYICILNNDVIAPPGTLRTLLEALRGDPAYGAVSPLFYADAARQSTWCLGTGIDPLNGKVQIFHARAPLPPGARIQPAPFLPGACILVRRAALLRPGLLPELYFLFYEDVDWSLALRRAGWQLGFVPAAQVVHEGSHATGSGTVTPYYSARNFQLFLARHPGVAADTRLARRYHRHWCAKEGLQYLRQRRYRPAAAIVEGYLAGLVRRTGPRRG